MIQYLLSPIQYVSHPDHWKKQKSNVLLICEGCRANALTKMKRNLRRKKAASESGIVEVIYKLWCPQKKRFPVWCQKTSPARSFTYGTTAKQHSPDCF